MRSPLLSGSLRAKYPFYYADHKHPTTARQGGDHSLPQPLCALPGDKATDAEGMEFPRGYSPARTGSRQASRSLERPLIGGGFVLSAEPSTS